MAANSPAPKWATTWKSKYTSGVAHAFILHFDVADYAAGTTLLHDYIAKVMLGSDPNALVVFYDRTGWSFPLPSMKKDVQDLLGLNTPAPVAGPLAGLLGQAAAPSQGAPSGPDLPAAPGAALPLIDKLLRITTRRVCVIIRHAETIVPEATIGMMSDADRTALVTVSKWGADPEIATTGNTVIMFTPNLPDIHSQIRAASSKWESITVDLPGHDARLNFIQLAGQLYPAVRWELSPAELANAAAGLSLIHIQDILLRAAQEGELTYSLVRERKQDIIASEYEVLEIMEPTFGWEAIGGLAHVKTFFDRSVIQPLRTGNRNRCPMGVLMTGPAGTGKSAVAQAVAKEAGVNAVALNLARILGQYVGNSERNLEKALQAIRSLAPTIVFIDEIDQSVSRGQGGDSGVSNRIFKRLLEFMSDTSHRGSVVFLAATNRPDLLDAALRRPGRFDKKIPFLIPDPDERQAIFRVMTRKYLSESWSADDATIAATEGWTGAEIEAAVIKAIEIGTDEGLHVTPALAAAVSRLSPSTADIEYMTMLAIRECNDTDLLPPRYRSMLQDRTALDQNITAAQRDRKLNL